MRWCKTNGVITPSMASFIRARGQVEKQGKEVLKAAFGPHGALGRKGHGRRACIARRSVM
jgi:hypothetical protein